MKGYFFRKNKSWEIMDDQGSSFFKITLDEVPDDVIYSLSSKNGREGEKGELRRWFEDEFYPSEEFGRFLIKKGGINKKGVFSFTGRDIDSEIEKNVRKKFSNSRSKEDLDFIFSKFMDFTSSIWKDFEGYDRERVLKGVRREFFSRYSDLKGKEKEEPFIPIKVEDCVKIVLTDLEKESKLESYLEALWKKRKDVVKDFYSRLIEKGADEKEIGRLSIETFLNIIIPSVAKGSDGSTFRGEEYPSRIRPWVRAPSYQTGREKDQIIERPEQLTFAESKSFKIGDRIRVNRPFKIKTFNRERYFVIPRGEKGIIEDVIEKDGWVCLYKIWFDNSDLIRRTGTIPIVPGEFLSFEGEDKDEFSFI